MRFTDDSRSTRFRRRVLRLLVAGFVCRALIPVGFMPAPLGAGGPVAICHGGVTGLFLEALAERRSAAAEEHGADHGAHADHGHADHASGHAGAADGHEAVDHSGWEHCPVGAAYTAAPLSHELSLSLLSLEHVALAPEPAAAPVFDLISPYRARGPPGAALSRQLS